jgi:hypothetical protein
MELSKEEHTQIAKTIMEQLGGGRFTMMVGAKDYMALSNTDLGGLQFGLKRSPGVKCNRVRITLNAMDTYDVKFIRYNSRSMKEEVLNEVEGVYFDQLQTIFTQNTGLYTKF